MKSYGQYCGLARALDRVGQRWTLLIVRELLLGPKRFTDLREGLPGIANNLLAERLRQLQDDGLILQRALPPPAASTVYELTESGRELRDAVAALIRWGGRWMAERPDDGEFQAGWLVLALDALGLGERLQDDLIVELGVEDETIRSTSAGGRLVPTSDLTGAPDVLVTGDPPALLGAAAGAIPPAIALRTIRLQPDDAATARWFEETFPPAADPAPGAERRKTGADSNSQ